MDEINSNIGSFKNNQDKLQNQAQSVNIDTESINSVFVTCKKEDKRTTFAGTFKEVDFEYAPTKQGQEFLEGLKKNKESLMADLGLGEEEYDALSCVALALASQETGMGLERGYISENIGIGKMIRTFLKELSYKKDSESASSGLTQMKIYDLKHPDTPKEENALPEEKRALFEKYGITADGINDNNLYDNPDKSAVATMIVLSHYVENYDSYLETIKNGFDSDETNSHEATRARLDENLTDEECIERGLGIIENIEEFYDTLADKDKETFRTTLANWVLSYDGSVNTKEYKKEHPNNKDKSFFEDVNLDKLNKMLKKTDIKLEQGDLDYIRYALTDESQALNIVEFSAYAWNKGINSSSMKADRLVANKIKTIFMLPENFGESQFSVNIAYLTNKYAQNANADFSDVEYLLNEYSKK